MALLSLTGCESASNEVPDTLPPLPGVSASPSAPVTRPAAVAVGSETLSKQVVAHLR
jgi:hypothetical protein